MKKALSVLLMLILALGVVGAAAEAKTPLRVVLIGGYLYEDNTNAINGQPQKGVRFMEEQFEALHPDIDLTLIIMGWDDYQKKTQTMIMGDEADVFVAPGLSLMGDMLEDLTPYIERDQFDTSVFLDGQLAGWQAQGGFDTQLRQYGFPFQGDTRVIAYDKQLFDEWGVPYLSEHPTWDEILEKAAKMTGENPVSKVQNYGTTLSGADAIVQIAESMGMPWGEGYAMGDLTFNWNKPEYVAASQLMLKLYALGMVGGSTNFGQADNTQAIELRSGSWTWFNCQQRGLGDRYGVALMPVNPNTGKSGMFAGGPLVISRNSSVKDAAWEFLKYAVSEDAQKFINENVYGEAMPVIKAAANWDAFKVPQAALVLQAMTESTTPRWVYRAESVYKGAIDNAASSILNGSDIQQALDAAVQEAEAHRAELQ
jgi:ABC-type glycerol-3-phosphate transport system substrate-binding protein